jgi:hypothetical protein
MIEPVPSPSQHRVARRRSFGARHFTDRGGRPWSVTEWAEPDGADGQGARFLVFRSAAELRRVDRFPAHWRLLGDPELEALRLWG